MSWEALVPRVLNLVDIRERNNTCEPIPMSYKKPSMIPSLVINVKKLLQSERIFLLFLVICFCERIILLFGNCCLLLFVVVMCCCLLFSAAAAAAAAAGCLLLLGFFSIFFSFSYSMWCDGVSD